MENKSFVQEEMCMYVCNYNIMYKYVFYGKANYTRMISLSRSLSIMAINLIGVC